MIITFSKKFAASRLHNSLVDNVTKTVHNVSVTKYRLTWQSDSPVGNLISSITWYKGRRVRFTIETRDAWKHGSRTSANGRHMRKASWEAHRDVMRALLKADPAAIIRTGFATYRGLKDFELSHESTAHRNVGSIVQPVTFRETTI